jgi:hypothetical protein
MAALLAILAGCDRGPSTTSADSQENLLIPPKSVYDVSLKPETKVIDANVMSHAYRGVGSDGALQFDASSAPSVASLTPGTTFSGPRRTHPFRGEIQDRVCVSARVYQQGRRGAGFISC